MADRIHSQISRNRPSSIEVRVTKVPRHSQPHSIHSQYYRAKTKGRRSNTVSHVTIGPPTDTYTNHNQSTQSAWISDDTLSKTNDFDQKHSCETISEVKRCISKSHNVVYHTMRDKHPVWSNFKHKTYHKNVKKKKRNKYSRRCRCAILMIVLLLAIVAILLALLIKPSSATTRNIIAVLRWNQSGITVAGIVAKSGNTSNLFNRPHGLVIDFSTTLYIADRHNHRIQKWPMNALTGITIAGQANGTAGPSVSDLDRPTDLAIDSTGNVYIADSWNHRIQFWENGTSQGSTIAGTGGILNITLNLPYGLTRDPNSGILYIADTSNHRVIRYRLGELVGTVVVGGNGPGPNNTQLSSPGGLYFDSPSNSLLIANSAAHNIVRWVMGADSWILVAGNLNGTLGNTSMELNSAFDVEMDPMGNVYVADRSNHRIQFFLVGQSTGVTIAGVTGATGINSTRLNTPSSMTLDNQLNLYVADTNNHRIQKFLRY